MNAHAEFLTLQELFTKLFMFVDAQFDSMSDSVISHHETVAFFATEGAHFLLHVFPFHAILAKSAMTAAFVCKRPFIFPTIETPNLLFLWSPNRRPSHHFVKGFHALFGTPHSHV